MLAISSAILMVAGFSSDMGTAWFNRPHSTACSALTISPVSSICMVFLRGTLRDKATMGVEQKSPICTPGVAKLASSAATARSQVATSWHPAAVAVPCTEAMTGFGQAIIACITWEHLVMVLSKKARPLSGWLRAAVNSFRSCPAQKTGPLALRITTLIRLSSDSRLIASCSASSIARDKLFLASGRFSVSVAIVPSWTSST